MTVVWVDRPRSNTLGVFRTLTTTGFVIPLFANWTLLWLTLALTSFGIPDLREAAVGDLTTLATTSGGVPGLVRLALVDMRTLTLASDLVEDGWSKTVDVDWALTTTCLEVPNLTTLAGLSLDALGNTSARLGFIDVANLTVGNGIGTLALTALVVKDLRSGADGDLGAHALPQIRVVDLRGFAGRGWRVNLAPALLGVPKAIDAAVARSAVRDFHAFFRFANLLLVLDTSAGVVANGLGTHALGEGTTLAFASVLVEFLV